MKVYKVELMIIDFDEIGSDEIKGIIEIQKFPNRCISPDVMSIESRDIGEWQDSNKLNYNHTRTEEYERLFATEESEEDANLCLICEHPDYDHFENYAECRGGYGCLEDCSEFVASDGSTKSLEK